MKNPKRPGPFARREVLLMQSRVHVAHTLRTRAGLDSEIYMLPALSNASPLTGPTSAVLGSESSGELSQRHPPTTVLMTPVDATPVDVVVTLRMRLYSSS